MENNFPYPTPSPVSNQPSELFVWLNSDSLRSVYVLDNGRSRSRSFSLHVFGHVRPIGPEPRAWKDASTCRGVLDVGRRFHSDRTFICSFDSGRLERCARVATSRGASRRKR